MKSRLYLLILILIISLNKVYGQSYYYSLYEIDGYTNYYNSKYNNKDISYFEQRISDLSTDSLKSFLSDSSSRIGVWNVLSLIPLTDEEYDDFRLLAILSYMELLKRGIRSKAVFYYGGDLKKEYGLTQEAIRDFTRAIMSDSLFHIKNYKIIGERGELKVEIGDYYGAIEDLTIAIDSMKKESDFEYIGKYKMENKKPELYFYFIARAKVYIYLKKFDDAIRDLSENLRLHPKCDECYYLRGISNLSLEKIEDGCKDLSKANELGNEKALELIQKYCKPNN